MKATLLRTSAAFSLAVSLLGGCGESSGECGLLPASTQIDGHSYNADSRYGIPVEVGKELAHAVRPATCRDRAPREVPGYAIVGIPRTVAVYAPEAFGEEFILINEDADWEHGYLQHLTSQGKP